MFADVFAPNKWGSYKVILLLPKNDPKVVELAAEMARLKNGSWTDEEPQGPHKEALRTDGKYGDSNIEYWAEFTTQHAPRVVDMQGREVTQMDLRGCQVRIAFNAETWQSPQFGSGTKLYLNGIQLVADSAGPGRSASEVAAMFATGEPENTSSVVAADAPQAAPQPAAPPADEDVPF